MEKNLTTGSVPKTMAYFALPYLLSYFLQTLYGMADLFIIGQFCGNDAGATTAVANGSQVMHMLTVILVGLAMGTTVVIGKAVGAKKLQDAQAAIGNTVTIFMIISVLLTVMLLIFINPIVAVMDTPEEAVKGITDYLIVCFIGIPFITAYNVISSIFRGLGDSKSPMYFIAVACGLNIALDYIFIGVCGMGPLGAALGTTLAQTFSVIISFVAIKRMNTGLRLTKNDFVPRRSVLGEIVKIGLPVAVQDGCIQIAFIIITVIANKRGVNDAAAVGVGLHRLFPPHHRQSCAGRDGGWGAGGRCGVLHLHRRPEQPRAGRPLWSGPRPLLLGHRPGGRSGAALLGAL